MSRRWALCPLFLLQACHGGLFSWAGNSETRRFDVEPQAILAVGGWLTFTVRDNEFPYPDTAGIGFQLLSVSDEQVVHIRSVTPDADLVVDGLMPGQARIGFSAVADGDRINDGFTIGVDGVTRVAFSQCRDGGVYVRGTDGQVNYTFAGIEGPVLKGQGVYPFTIDPAGALTLRPDLSATDAWQFGIAPDAPDLVRVVSALPGDTAEYDLAVVDQASIDGIVPSDASSNTYYSRSLVLQAVPTSAGRPVCGQIRRVVTSATPDICQLKAVSTDPTPRLNDKTVRPDLTSIDLSNDLVEAHFIGAGTCTITLSLPDLGVTLAWPTWNLTAVDPASGG